jgi:PD-(D/E)XK nuclease superfamily
MDSDSQRLGKSSGAPSFESFLESYKKLIAEERSQEEEGARGLQLRLPTLVAGLKGELTRQRERQCKEAPNFNLLRLLSLHVVERHHSEILADLLNPAGTHAQGDFFLVAFLRGIGQPRVRSQVDLSVCIETIIATIATGANVQIKREDQVNDSSRLDIVLRCLPWFEIYIENKIKSHETISQDGFMQLQKYRRHLTELKANKVIENGLLVYLTIDPKEKSSGYEHLHISYRTDIRCWLKECLRTELPPRVKHTIDQYLESIDDLCNVHGSPDDNE